MDIIRNKLLISSLQKNIKYKKSINDMLLKFIKEEEISNTLKTAFDKKDSFETLLYLVDTGDFFNNALEKTVTKIWKTLSEEQKQQIFRTMFNEKNRQQTDTLLGESDSPDSSYAKKLFKNSMGELLYDKSFLDNLKGLYSLRYILFSEYQNIDYEVYNRIINDDLLLDYYLKYTDIFYNISSDVFSNLSELQIKKLVEKGRLSFLNKSGLKNDVDFVENIIVNNSKELDKWFVGDLPEDIKKNPRILFSLLLSNSPFFDILADEQTIKTNLFILRDNDEYQKFRNSKYGVSNKLYILANTPDFLSLGDTKGVIWDTLTQEEKKYFELTRRNVNEKVSNKIDKLGLVSSSKDMKNILKFYDILKINNDVLKLGISNKEITKNCTNILPVILDLAEKSQLNRVTANNLYYAIANSTLDIFLELCNLGLADRVNMSLITKDLIEKVGYDIVKNVSLFPESFYYLLELEKRGKLDIYKKMLKLIDDLPLDKVRSTNILLYTCISYEKFIQRLTENEQLTSENIMLLINITRSFSFIDLNECNSLEEYCKKMYTLYDEKIVESKNPLICRELLCQRFFMRSYEHCMEFCDSAISGIHKTNNAEFKKIFKIFLDLKDCNDVDYIKEKYMVLKQENFKLMPNELFNIEENLKKEIIGEYLVADTLNNADKNTILDFTGKKFNCLIHVVGAYGEVNKAENLWASWNSTNKIENSGICTILLSDNYFGHAPTREHSVIFGFDNISPGEIQIMGPYDLYSCAYGLETYSMSGRASKYYNSSDLINNTRALHNEVVINRNLKDGQKRQPSYILCFDNVNEESKEASEKFGVPIIFIDTKKHIEMKLQELEDLKKEFINTQSADIMKKIINMQETLKCGLMVNNKEMVENIFNPEFITSNILFLISNCNDEKLLNQLYEMLKREETRFYDEKDYRTVKFSGDLEYLYEQINIRKRKLSENQAFVQ